MLLDVLHADDDERLEARAVRGEPLDFEARVREPVGDLFRRCFEPGNERAQPAIRCLHRERRLLPRHLAIC